jgi:hypothetical protein
MMIVIREYLHFFLILTYNGTCLNRTTLQNTFNQKIHIVRIFNQFFLLVMEFLCHYIKIWFFSALNKSLKQFKANELLKKNIKPF